MKKITEGSLTQKFARLLISYRRTPQSTSSTGVAPSELLVGRKFRLGTPILT